MQDLTLRQRVEAMQKEIDELSNRLATFSVKLDILLDDIAAEGDKLKQEHAAELAAAKGGK